MKFAELLMHTAKWDTRMNISTPAPEKTVLTDFAVMMTSNNCAASIEKIKQSKLNIRLVSSATCPNKSVNTVPAGMEQLSPDPPTELHQISS